ncbi:MAG: Pteridine reductase [Gammaproteobacteria bacterium]|nr:Pteridine reductase [Gammaproteobacteria bacterium]
MPNKTVLITGAAGRIGAVIARLLHAETMDIVIHYRHSAAGAAALVRELNQIRPRSATAVQADLVKPGATTHIIASAVTFNNRLDVLINNASSFYPTPVVTTTEEQWQDLIDTNMKAPFFLAQQAAPHLRTQSGCIINITDIHGQRPLRTYPVYSAAKAGLVMLTQALAKELAPEIRVNGIAPGAILWPEELAQEVKDKILSRTVLGYKGEPADIARAVKFLIEDADYMTGQILTIDGGRSLFS